ncbi:MAG: substrate-binding domain-containing protein [Gemmatimonadaceae bacterium]|nr:substrate-binding domain-containing protein [Gloeobacterales cyanobacterium ES-bin-141]
MSYNRFSLGRLLSTASMVGSLAASLSLVTVTAQSASAQVYAGGATTPSLVYQYWFDELGGVYNYASVGSSAGIRSFLDTTTTGGALDPATLPGDPDTYNNQGFSNSDGTVAMAASSPPPGLYPYPRVDIGAIDTNLSSFQIGTVYPGSIGTRRSLVQVPTVASPVNIAYNRTGLNTAGNPGGVLRLNRQAYCGIFSGRIRNWNNSTITTSNRGTQVSTNLPIVVVRRSDGSGTTENLTTHLDAVCTPLNDWTIGFGTTVAWPASFLSASGNSGVVSLTTSTSGAGRITYVSPSFVAPIVSGGLPSARLETQYALTSGVDQYVGPTITNTANALLDVTLPANPTPTDYGTLSYQMLRPTMSNAYPIIGVTYILLYGDYSGAPGVSTLIKDFVNYYTTAGTTACTLAGVQGFACFSEAIRAQIRTTVSAITP